MALTGEQKVNAAALAYETYETIDKLAATRNADQVAAIEDELDLWQTVKNKQHIRLEGGSGGVDLNFERKEEAIRRRVRIAFGLRPIASVFSPTPKPFAGGISQSDMASRRSNSDRPRLGFSAELHRER